MADLKISALLSVSTLGNTDLFCVVKSGVTSKITKSDLITTLGITSYYQTFQEEGASVTQRAIVDFQGAGLTVSDNGSKTIVALDGDLNQISSLTSTRGSIMVGNSSNAWSTLSIGTAGKILRSDGTDLLYSTLTIPDTITANYMLYASATNVLTALATGNSNILVTNGSGVPAFGTDIPTAITIGGAYVYRVGGTDVATTDGGWGQDISTAWTTFVSTITGFSGTPTQTCSFKQVGKIVFCEVIISGTSNATTFTFTLPTTCLNSVQLQFGKGTNNSADSNCSAISRAGSDVVDCFTSNGLAAWINVLGKSCKLVFCYQAG